MELKRSLVVDDARSARQFLRQLLEEHDIFVETAESAEVAIEFLKHNTVDVIFMDHTMPGMDGLEAVSVIKKDPRTAMIPVMMYTAKEGEVYVGQARALGALGVLPKDVKRADLFEVLKQLGLVSERRAERQEGDLPSKPQLMELERRRVDRLEQGFELQSLVKRIMVDQVTRLRSDLLSSFQEIAQQVVDELQARQYAERSTPVELIAEAPVRSYRWPVWGIILALTLTGLVTWRYLQIMEQRDQAFIENQMLTKTIGRLQEDVERNDASLSAAAATEKERHQGSVAALVDALQWSLNRDNRVAFHELPMNNRRLEILRGLLSRLNAIGFTGKVRLESHLGEFCLSGETLAKPELLVAECERFGNPLDEAAGPESRQSADFIAFLEDSNLTGGGAISVEIIAHDRLNSEARYSLPLDAQTAGEWNRIAELNNRVEILLLPNAR